jgi:hypothetical protein
VQLIRIGSSIKIKVHLTKKKNAFRKPQIKSNNLKIVKWMQKVSVEKIGIVEKKCVCKESCPEKFVN